MSNAIIEEIRSPSCFRWTCWAGVMASCLTCEFIISNKTWASTGSEIPQMYSWEESGREREREGGEWWMRDGLGEKEEEGGERQGNKKRSGREGGRRKWKDKRGKGRRNRGRGTGREKRQGRERQGRRPSGREKEYEVERK